MASNPKKQTPKNLFKRGSVWWIQSNRHGERIVQSTGTDVLKDAIAERDRVLNPANLTDKRDRAEAVLARLQGIDQQLLKVKDDLPATTIQNGWQAYIDQQNRPDSGPSTLRCYQQWFEAFVRWMQETHSAATELRHVTQAHADQYAGKLQREVAATTFNRHMNTLALVWRVLENTARITGNPWKQIARKRFIVHTRRELTIEELGRLCAAAKGETRLLLALGIYCGLRLGDAALLRWSDVDMVKGVVSLVPQKTARRSQKRVTLPIHRTLFSLLAETPESARKGYVLPGIAERHQQYAGALSKDIGDLFGAVGIETKAEVAGSKRKRADCGFHSLRHTFVSLCAAGGVPQSVVQSLVGHGSPAMTAHYTHIGLEAAKSAVASLPDVTGAPLPSPAAATPRGDDVGAALAMLANLDIAGLKTVAAKAQELIMAKGAPQKPGVKSGR